MKNMTVKKTSPRVQQQQATAAENFKCIICNLEGLDTE